VSYGHFQRALWTLLFSRRHMKKPNAATANAITPVSSTRQEKGGTLYRAIGADSQLGCVICIATTYSHTNSPKTKRVSATSLRDGEYCSNANCNLVLLESWEDAFFCLFRRLTASHFIHCRVLPARGRLSLVLCNSLLILLQSSSGVVVTG
jgi:hypothetical protein